MRIRLKQDVDGKKKGFTFVVKSQSKNDYGIGFVTEFDEKITVPNASYFEEVKSMKVDMDRPLNNRREPADEEEPTDL